MRSEGLSAEEVKRIERVKKRKTARERTEAKSLKVNAAAGCRESDAPPLREARGLRKLVAIAILRGAGKWSFVGRSLPDRIRGEREKGNERMFLSMVW